jgi:hypothetical protein
MPEMLFLSEYRSDTKNRTAWLCQRTKLNDYVAIGYENSLERAAHPFASKSQAEDWCEDWVLLSTPE